MKFGIFYEHQLPRPWTETSEAQLFADALAQCEEADKLGFDYIWEVEHHFLEEYSHSSAPEVFLAALSQRTKHIRLGHGIVQTPPPFNHPARVAERIATLDIVSNGRVDFGTGESSSEAELGGFGIDPFDKRQMWEEGLRVAVRCLTESPFTGFAGKWVNMPPRNVVPKSIQKPHPPIWVACSRRDTIHLAAQHGIGALSFAFINPEEAKQWVSDYYDTLAKECVPIGDEVNANVAIVTPLMCCESEDQALERGTEGSNFFGYSLAHYYIFGKHRPGITDVWSEYIDQRAQAGYSPEAVIQAAKSPNRLGAKVIQDGESGLRGAVGTPEQIRDFIHRYEECGIDQIIFVSQAGNNRHEHIMESLELFAREVMPEFKDSQSQADKIKAQRLGKAIEMAMERKPDSDHPPLADPDYEFPAIPMGLADRMGNDQFYSLLNQIEKHAALGDLEGFIQDVSQANPFS